MKEIQGDMRVSSKANKPDSTEQVSLRKVWYVFVLAIAPLFLYGLFRLSLGLVLPQISSTFGLTNTGAGALATISVAATGVTTVIGGAFSDKLGEKKVMVSGVLCYGLGMIAAMLSTVYLLFITFLVISGLGSGMMMIPTYQMVGVIAPSLRGISVGLISSGYNFGGFAGQLLVGSLSYLGWRAPFIVTGGAAILTGFLQLSLLKPRYTNLANRPQRMFRINLTQNIIVLSMGMLLADFAFLAFATWTPSYMIKVLGVNEGLTSVVFGFAILAGVGGILLAGYLLDKISGKVAALIIGILSTIFSTMLYLLGQFDAYLAILLIGTGFATNGFWSLLSVLAQRSAKEGYIGTATGIVQGFGFVGAISAPFVGGVLVDSLPSFSLALISTVTIPYVIYTFSMLAFSEHAHNPEKKV
jgi:MFS family permease